MQNDLKIGDKVKIKNLYQSYYYRISLNKVYKILGICKDINFFMTFIDLRNDDNYIGCYDKSKFIKVDCLKNKIRKLKRLLRNG